ncbi:c-type cytochrome [Paenibacillus luteus]|uniref:c-type cytochrome n=1 Tax=Paenibacillus luteus TaxID=2545753 RepID=UPI0011430363|nr:cytochrome c [Paenibacillus luteus]
MKQKLKQVTVMGVIALTVMLSGCASTATNDRVEYSNSYGEVVETGEAAILYKKMCISCHGAELKGRAGPNLQNVGARLSNEQIVEVVTNGRKGMPKFGKSITAEEIQQLADWLSELK